MNKPATDELIADMLAIHLEVQRRVQDKRYRVTPFQVKVFANAATSLNRFLIAWQTHSISPRKVMGL